MKIAEQNFEVSPTIGELEALNSQVVAEGTAREDVSTLRSNAAAADGRLTDDVLLDAYSAAVVSAAEAVKRVCGWGGTQ